MDIRWAGRELVKGNQLSWEEVPPVDLTLRLTDVLQYEDCNPTDLWEAFRDWMESRGMTRPQARPLYDVARINPSQKTKSVAAITQTESAMQLTRLVYASRHEKVGSAALDTILKSSQKNNTRDLVSGVLVVEEGNFLQLIEGRRDAIAKCFKRIMEDKRHHDVQVISCGDVSKRLFQDWSMRLVKVCEIKREILSVLSVEGKFQPRIMSEFTIEEFCRTLALGDIEVNAA